jgi:hypothetical protein
MKIALACFLIVFFLFVLAGSRWFVGEEDLSGSTLLVYPVAAIGIVLCLFSIAKELIGIYWNKNRS